jgi:hypothetical protein
MIGGDLILIILVDVQNSVRDVMAKLTAYTALLLPNYIQV